jgi:hypothetical protein
MALELSYLTLSPVLLWAVWFRKGRGDHEIIACPLPFPLHELFGIVAVDGLWYTHIFYKIL